jgi:microcin C transport system substrate-binding protein
MDSLINQYRAASDAKTMMALSHEMNQLHHDYASFVPGFQTGFFRLGHWRWIRYPEHFSYKHAAGATQHFVHWIDESRKSETTQAKQGGDSFAAQVIVYDQHRAR